MPSIPFPRPGWGAGNPFEPMVGEKVCANQDLAQCALVRKQKGNKNMQCKYTEVPKYETVDIVAKTSEAITGTIDRKLVGRALLTTAAGFEGKHQVVGGDGTVIRTVAEIGEGEGKAGTVELFVELVGGIRSLASYKFFKGYVGANPENAGVKDLYTDDGVQVQKIIDTAKRMCADHPECDSQWKIVDKDGNRWFLRKIVTDVKANGMFD